MSPRRHHTDRSAGTEGNLITKLRILLALLATKTETGAAPATTHIYPPDQSIGAPLVAIGQCTARRTEELRCGAAGRQPHRKRASARLRVGPLALDVVGKELESSLRLVCGHLVTCERRRRRMSDDSERCERRGDVPAPWTVAKASLVLRNLVK